MRRSRSRPVIVTVLALAYPTLVLGLGAIGFTISALLTRSDSNEFGDFDEGGGLIFALLVAPPVAVTVAHLAWAGLAARLVNDPCPRSVASMTAILFVTAVAAFVVVGSGGPVHLDGWWLLAAAAAVLTVSAALTAVWLLRTTSEPSGRP